MGRREVRTGEQGREYILLYTLAVSYGDAGREKNDWG